MAGAGDDVADGVGDVLALQPLDVAQGGVDLLLDDVGASAAALTRWGTAAWVMYINGGGIWAVRIAPCATVGTWSVPVFSDQVTRLIDDTTGGSLSIGTTIGGHPPPSAFILYGAYTGSPAQHFTLS